LVKVSQRSLERIQSLLQPAIKTFARFFTQVSDVIGGYDRLDVGGKPAASGLKVNAFGDEVDLDALV